MVSSTHKPRIGRRLLVKMGLRQSGFNEKFDDSHKRYTYLKHYVHELHESLEQYALQIARQTEAGRALGDVAGHLYETKNTGFKSVIAFKDAQEQNHSGYAGQIHQAFVKGVVEPVVEWKKELEGMEVLVTNFNDVRVQHDHYLVKVEDLAAKALSLEQRAMTHGDGKDAKAAAEKLRRNTGKLEAVKREYDQALKAATDGMDKAWKDRLRMMNNFVALIIQFQETFYSQQLMIGLGVSRILSEELPGVKPAIQKHVPKGDVRHFEGELTRKYKITRARMWFRLVGSSLEVYSMKHKEDDPSYVVIDTPKVVHKVTGVQRVSDTHLRVSVLKDEQGLYLVASDAADGQAWFDALERACVWDVASSAQTVETHVRNSDAFLKRVKIAYANNTTCEGIEKSLGVTEALANPKKPDADRPPSIQAGGESLKAGGGGGGKAGGKSGKGNAGAGGNAAAGIAPGGEQGVGWGAVPWGLTPGGANGAVGGKKGKKGGKMKALGMGEEKTEFGVEYGEEKMPDLVDSSHRSALGYSTAVAGVAAAGMNGMGGSFSSNRGMVPPRGMPPSMGGSMTNGMHHRGMSNGVGPHPPGMNMSMMARGPRPTMPQGHSSARMMLENPPPVMMGPDGPVTLIQGGMQGASMPGGPSVMMGPNGPVTLMGAGTPGQTGGAWGSSFGARGPWGSTSTMGSRSFATRFGPQRTRPGIIQRTRSLGMENVPGPYGYTRDDVMYDDQTMYPPHHAHHSSLGPGSSVLGAAAATATMATGAAALNGVEGAPAPAPASAVPAPAAAIPTPVAPTPAPAPATETPVSTADRSVSAESAAATTTAPKIAKTPVVAPVAAAPSAVAYVDEPTDDDEDEGDEMFSAEEKSPLPDVEVTQVSKAAAATAAAAGAAAAAVAAKKKKQPTTSSANMTSPMPTTPATGSRSVDVQATADKASVSSRKLNSNRSAVFARPKDIDATLTATTEAPKTTGRSLSIDPAVAFTTESAKTSRPSRGRTTGALSTYAGFVPKTPDGDADKSANSAEDARASADDEGKQKKPYRGWRRMMSLGSGTDVAKRYAVNAKDGYDGAADTSSSGADSRQRSDAPRSRSLTRTKSERWPTRKKTTFPKDVIDADEASASAAADSTSDDKASVPGPNAKPAADEKLQAVQKKSSRSLPDFGASAKSSKSTPAAGAPAAEVDTYPSPVGPYAKPSMNLGEERKATPTESEGSGFSRPGKEGESSSGKLATSSSGRSSGSGKIAAGWAAAAAAAVGLGSSRNKTATDRSKTSEIGDGGDGTAPSSGDMKRSLTKQTSFASTVVNDTVAPSPPAPAPALVKPGSVKERVASMNEKISGGVAGGSPNAGVTVGSAEAGGGGASFDLVVDGTRGAVDVSDIGIRGGGVHAPVTGDSGTKDVGVLRDLDVSGLDTNSTVPTTTATPFITSKNTSMNTPLGGVVGFSPTPDAAVPGGDGPVEVRADQAPMVDKRENSAAADVETSDASGVPSIAPAVAGSGTGTTKEATQPTPVVTEGYEGDESGSQGNGSGTVSSSGSNIDPAVAQAKVFLRLCGARVAGSAGGSVEAEGGDAGGGGEEPTLSFEQLMAWDEVQELIDYGALKESEVKTVWTEALRSQDERTIASTAKAHGDIWTSPTPSLSETKEESKAGDAMSRHRRGGEPSAALTQRGFSMLVKLIEELQFEKELEQERGVGLVPGPVCVV